MLYHAKNGTLQLGSTEMDYIRFGNGSRKLLMLPGLGDGLQTVKGTALPMALMYREFCRDFTVWVFSRRKDLPEGYTTRDMARDQAEAMSKLGIGRADVLGVSMGGMIAQWRAIDYPEKVGTLILAVTCARPNPILAGAVEEWVALARQGDHTAFMDSNLRRIYSGDYCRKNRWLVPLLGRLTKPKSYGRFFLQAAACRNHDAYGALTGIRAQTLVVGGGQDKALGGEASEEVAAAIPGAQLKIYAEWGHGLYEEEKGFNAFVLSFLA